MSQVNPEDEALATLSVVMNELAECEIFMRLMVYRYRKRMPMILPDEAGKIERIAFRNIAPQPASRYRARAVSIAADALKWRTEIASKVTVQAIKNAKA